MRKNIAVLLASMLLPATLLASDQQLKVPYYWQSYAGWCWAASASMVAKYYNQTPNDGTQIKPWWCAQLLEKDSDEGAGSGSDWSEYALVFAEIDPVRTYEQSAPFINWLDSVYKSYVTARLDQGTPVLIRSHDNTLGGHAMVITAYDDETVSVSDPSSALFRSAGRALNVKMTWANFFDTIDTSLTNDGFLISAEESFTDTTTDAVSFDLCPSYYLAGNKIDKSGILSEPANATSLELEWSGKDWPGYYFEGDISWRRFDDGLDPNYEDYVIYQDELKIYPFMTCYDDTAKTVYFDIKVFNDGSPVWTYTSSSVTVPGESHKYDTLIATIPVRDFYNDLGSDECKLQMVCKESGTNIEQDRLEMGFRVDLNPLTLSIQSDPSGANISINYPDQDGNQNGTAPFTRKCAEGTDIMLEAASTAGGWAFKEWQTNGVTYSQNRTLPYMFGLHPATLKAVYQVMDSHIYVAGSANPSPYEVSISPGHGRYLDIPVKNITYAPVTVNCSKSGTASGWTTLETDSFDLDSQELKKYRVSIGVPYSASSGDYTSIVHINDVDFVIQIKVIGTDAPYTDVLQASSVWIDGEKTLTHTEFEKDYYDSLKIRGTINGGYANYTTIPNFDLDYCARISMQYYMSVSVPYNNLAASPNSNQDLLVYLNNNYLGDITAAENPIGMIHGWHTFQVHPNKLLFDDYATLKFFIGREESSSAQYKNTSDDVDRWEVYDISTNACKINYWLTDDAWAQDNIDIPSAAWNDMVDDYDDYIRLYAHVDSVPDSGRIYLYNNGVLVDYTSISSSSVGKEVYWDFSDNDIKENNNIFVLQSDAENYPARVQLSNIRFEVAWLNQTPNLDIIKSISPSPINVGGTATVTVKIENLAEDSSTGDDTYIYDATLPSGISLASGSLNDQLNDIGFEDVETHTYTIKGDAIGYYTLGQARVEYESIDGDDLVDESNIALLEVRGGSLVVAAEYSRIENSRGVSIEFEATVQGSIQSTSIEDADLVGEIYHDNGGTWELIDSVSLGFNPSTSSYVATSEAISLSGDYMALIKASRDLYDDGSSSEYPFVLVDEIPTYDLIVNSGSGDGSYTNGQQVVIIADAQTGNLVFDSWTGDVEYVDNIYSENTYVRMPSSAITVTATYRNDSDHIVALWDFENSTQTGTTPTNGQPFCTTVAGEHGSADIINGIVMRGLDDYDGPLFTTDNLVDNGIAMDVGDNRRYGYVDDTVLTMFSPQSWTIECTVRLDEADGWRTLIGKDGSSHGANESDFFLQKCQTNDFFRLNFRTRSNEQVIIDATDSTVQPNQWYGLVAQSDGTNAYLWIDHHDGHGYQLSGSHTFTGAPAGSINNSIANGGYNWVFGRGWFENNAVDHIDGRMDNIRFSSACLDPSEFIAVPVDPSEFYEDWETGEINTNKWKIWGSPSPSIVSGGNSIGNYAITSNGDSSYDSGVTSLQGFDVRPGLVVSAKMFIQAPGTDVWSNRSWQGVQLSSRIPAEWDNVKGWSDSTIGPAISIRGNTPLDVGLYVSIPGGGTNFSSAAWVDRWTEVGFLFNSDGSVTYLLDGAVLYTTSPGWIDYDTVAPAYLVCGGRSQGSAVTNLHDNISVADNSFNDNDGDGLPDWWEWQYFGGNASSDDDPDGDGQNNAMEYISGMDPTNSTSLFAITNVALLSNGQRLLQWPEALDRVYTVLWTDDLMSGFKPIGINLWYPTNSFLNEEPQLSQEFYKILVDQYPQSISNRMITGIYITTETPVLSGESSVYSFPIGCWAAYSDGSVEEVSPNWSVDSENAWITQTGDSLEANVQNNEYGITVTAEYSEWTAKLNVVVPIDQ